MCTSPASWSSVAQADALLAMIDVAAHENLVAADAHLLPAEGYVQAAMRLLNLARCQAAAVVGAANEQRLAVEGTARLHGAGSYAAVTSGHPMVLGLSDEHLVTRLDNLAAGQRNVGTAATGRRLARYMGAVVVGATDEQRRHVAVVAAEDGIRWCIAGTGRHPQIIAGAMGRLAAAVDRRSGSTHGWRVGGAAGRIRIQWRLISVRWRKGAPGSCRRRNLGWRIRGRHLGGHIGGRRQRGLYWYGHGHGQRWLVLRQDRGPRWAGWWIRICAGHGHRHGRILWRSVVQGESRRIKVRRIRIASGSSGWFACQQQRRWWRRRRRCRTFLGQLQLFGRRRRQLPAGHAMTFLHQNLIRVQTTLRAAIRNEQSTMHRRDFANYQMPLVVAASNIDGLFQLGATAEHRRLGYHVVVALDPGEILAAQYLEYVLGQGLAALRYEADLLGGHHLADEHIALMLRPAHIDHGAILIIAAHNGVRRYRGVRRRLHPFVGCNINELGISSRFSIYI